jgi:predicted regulator of Ras-like GTPase activity (Roadblock/LC7/MglB family)
MHSRFRIDRRTARSIVFAYSDGLLSWEWWGRKSLPAVTALLGTHSTVEGEGARLETMASPQMVMYEEEFAQVQAVTDRLVQDANARVVFVVDKNGQLIAGSGDTADLDTTSLASLAAGNIAATGGIAQLLREQEFATQYHEGVRQNVHIQVVSGRVILVVIFDNRTSLGLVRLRVKRANEQLTRIFEMVMAKAQDPFQASPFAEITDDDIDNLFND